MAVRFRDRYLGVSECSVRPKVAAVPAKKLQKHVSIARPKSQWMKNFYFTRPDKAALSAIPAAAIAGTKSIRQAGQQRPGHRRVYYMQSLRSGVSPK